MFFYVAKIAWFVVQPSSALLLAMALGALLLWGRWARAGRRIVTAGALLLLIAGLSPLGNALVLPLEERFAPAVLSDERPPDGVIVLGGAQDMLVSGSRNMPVLNEAGERVTEAVALAQRFPEARILYSGGSGTILYAQEAETVGARALFARLGLETARLELEDRARDTYENAVYAKALARPKAGERWLLVTSAFHMPRAIACFRQAGFAVEPWPVDYRTRGRQDLTRFFSRPSEGLRRVDMAAREWVGLVVYWLVGRTDALFPAP